MVQSKSLETFVKKLSSSPKNEYDGNSFVLELNNTELADNIERIEGLNVGDTLRLTFERINEKRVGRVCDSSNGEIGTLSAYAEMIAGLVTDNIIDIVSVVATSVVPVSKRKKGSKKALVSVKITFSEILDSIEEAEEEVLVDEVKLSESFEEAHEDSEILELVEEDYFDIKEADTEEDIELKLDDKLPTWNQLYDITESHTEIVNAAESIAKSVAEDEEVSPSVTTYEDSISQMVAEQIAVAQVSEIRDSGIVNAEEIIDHPAFKEAVAPVIEATYEEPDLEEQSVETYGVNTESVKCEIKFIMDTGIYAVSETLDRKKLDCEPLSKSLAQVMNVLWINKAENIDMYNYVFDTFNTQYENMYMYIESVNNKAIEYANSLPFIEQGMVNPKYKEKYNLAVSSMNENDSNILKVAEGLDKFWNAIPKDDSMEFQIERCMAVANKLMSISKQVVDLKDSYGNKQSTLKYVSMGILEGMYSKWQAAYDYIPFVKVKKHMFYMQELRELEAGFVKTRNYYGAIKQEKEDHLNAIIAEKEECESKLDNLGLFSFSSKKYCKERIQELEIEESRARSDLEEIARDYDLVINETLKKIENCKTKVAWYA